MEIKIGQIYFWNDTSKTIFASGIRYYNKRRFRRSDCTHCGIIAAITGDDCVVIYEADGDGFLPRVYSKQWLLDRIKDGIVNIGETKEPLQHVFENCQKYEGIKYGWLDIFGLALSALFGYHLLCIT